MIAGLGQTIVMRALTFRLPPAAHFVRQESKHGRDSDCLQREAQVQPAQDVFDSLEILDHLIDGHFTDVKGDHHTRRERERIER